MAFRANRKTAEREREATTTGLVQIGTTTGILGRLTRPGKTTGAAMDNGDIVKYQDCDTYHSKTPQLRAAQ